MVESLDVRVVESAADSRTFREFPWLLYAGSPAWVPPLLSMRRRLLDQRENPSWEYMEGEYFVAWRGMQPVGTVAAFVNHRHNEFHDENIAWFGAFEARDDDAVARALLDTAAEWARGRGFGALRGPQTFTTHEECGLLVEGFGRPVLLMPWNPPYYQTLVEDAGFHKYMDLYSYSMNRTLLGQGNLFERLRRITQRVMKRNKICVRPIESRRLKAEFARFRELYNRAWDRNQGFVPMTERELDALVADLGTFFDPDFAFFADVDGEPAGFVLGIPDFNQVLLRARPRPGIPEPLTLLRALWHWKARPVIDTVRIPLLGVHEKFRQRGVDVALYFHILEACMRHGRIQHADGGWVLESNTAMRRIVQNMGLQRYRTHRLYERSLS